MFDSVVYSICRSFLLVLGKTFFRLQVRGRENLPASGPVILAGNHASFLDPPLVGLASTRHLTFLAKQELFFFPLSLLIRRLGAVPLSRGSGDAGALRTVVRLLRQEKAVVLFPEGTRTTDGKLQTRRTGVALIAQESGATIVPTIIKGTYAAWPRHRRLPRWGRVTVEFCPPLAPDDYREILQQRGGRKKLVDHIMVEIARRYDDQPVPPTDHAIGKAS